MAVVNITVENDADFYREFQFATDDEVPISIAGSTMEMMLRRRAEDETAVVRFATDTGEIAFTNAALGKFTLRILHTTLQRIGLGEYDQSLIMTMSGTKTKIWSGTLTNNPGATR